MPLARPRPRLLRVLVFTAGIALAGSATAALRAGDPSPAAHRSATHHRPERGETMAAVRARHGRPSSVRGPVGQPPITRWNYPGYHVYFEDNRVIHTVVPRHPEPLHHVARLRETSRSR